MPRLTIDRKSILSYDENYVEKILLDQVESLFSPGSNVLTFDWLCALAERNLSLADAIADKCSEQPEYLWRIGQANFRTATSGCFPADRYLFAHNEDQTKSEFRERLRPVSSLPDSVALWRLKAAISARTTPDPDDDAQQQRGSAEHIMPARPSDQIIISRDLEFVVSGRRSLQDQAWLDPATMVPLAHLLRAAAVTGRTVAEVSNRLRLLGFRTRDLPVGIGDVVPSRQDLRLASRGLDGRFPWLEGGTRVPLAHLLAAAVATSHTPGEIASRLELLGYLAVTPPTGIAEMVSISDDVMMISRGLDRKAPWLADGATVPLPHLMRAAAETGQTPDQALLRFRSLGYALPERLDQVQVVPPTPADRTLTSADLDGQAPWLDGDRAVPVAHVSRAVAVLGRSQAEIVNRLRLLGYSVPEVRVPTSEPDPGDRSFVSTDLNGSAPWLDADVIVPTAHVVAAAAVAGRKVSAVAERLQILGFIVSKVAMQCGEIPTEADRRWVSLDLDGQGPWLNDEIQVPQAHVFAAAVAAGLPARKIAARLAIFGYKVPRLSDGPTTRMTAADLKLISADQSGERPWIDDDVPVSLAHILRAALATVRTPEEIVRQLIDLGFPEPDPNMRAKNRVTAEDITSISLRLDSQPPWLVADRPVSLAHVLRVAVATDRTPHQVARRLSSLGFDMPDIAVDSPAMRPTRVDRLAMSRDLNGQPPWLPGDIQIPLAHLLATAAVTQRPLTEIAVRLNAIGYMTPHLEEVKLYDRH
ncbi:MULTISPECIES: hypothetical protein [unclassified Frankia]|uniref:wHTH domain-containing protein n=1 Tax=unclassified Frankia TaxID=2632575 RepID=UPI002AD26537|nr:MULTISPECIES: hypothetical protein [unclassified Frankia]